MRETIIGAAIFAFGVIFGSGITSATVKSIMKNAEEDD